MKNEEKLLVNICKSYFSGEELVVPDNIDWNKFYEISKNHNLTSVCHCVFNNNKEKMPENVQAFFLNKFLDLVYVFEKQVNAYEEIKELMKKEKIFFVAFKGIVLKDIYPIPESRTMGDIDILIHSGDEKKVKSLMESAGFLYDSTCGNVDVYKRENVTFEIHKKLTDDFEDKFDNAFENAVFNGFEGGFDDDYHFAYLVAHTAKHIKSEGAGIRLVLDIAFMLKNKNINLDNVFNMLNDINLLTFGKVILSVSNHWFGYGKTYVEINEKIEEYFLKCGAFGKTNDSRLQTVSRLKSLNALDKDGNSSPLKMKLRLAFPSYEKLIKMPYIKFINGRKWLVPVAWIYRFFYNLKNRKSQMIERFKNIDDKETMDMAQEELEFLEEVGLL